jgi:hypothetical protein
VIGVEYTEKQISSLEARGIDSNSSHQNWNFVFFRSIFVFFRSCILQKLYSSHALNSSQKLYSSEVFFWFRSVLFVFLCSEAVFVSTATQKQKRVRNTESEAALHVLSCNFHCISNSNW